MATTFTTTTRKAANEMLADFLEGGFAYSFAIAPQRGGKYWRITRSNDIADYRAELEAARQHCDAAIAANR